MRVGIVLLCVMQNSDSPGFGAALLRWSRVFFCATAMPSKSIHFVQFYVRDFFSNTGVQSLTKAEQKNWVWIIFSMYLDQSPTTMKTRRQWLAYLGIKEQGFERLCVRLGDYQLCSVTVSDDGSVSFYHERVAVDMESVYAQRRKSAESTAKHAAAKKAAQTDEKEQVIVTDGQSSSLTIPYTDTEAYTETDKKSIRSARAKRFIKPTTKEIQDYLISRIGNSPKAALETNKFFDHYESIGWVVGKNKPMKDWKAAARNWISRMPDYANNGEPKTRAAKTKNVRCPVCQRLFSGLPLDTPAGWVCKYCLEQEDEELTPEQIAEASKP